MGEEPGRLPRWRLRRPPKGEGEDPEAAVRERRGREERGPAWRPRYEAEDFIARGAGWIGVDVEALQPRRRTHDLVRARELLMALGVGRYGLKVWPALLTRYLLRAANGSDLSCFSKTVLLDVVRLRLRRPIREKPNISLPFAALVTRPGEKSGLGPRKEISNVS